MRNEAGAFTPGGLDALPPAEVARKAETVGVTKAWMAGLDVFVLSVLAGAFIAMGAIFATTVTAGGGELPYGVVRLLAGVTFSLGLVLVVVAGAELFTGNNLIVMAWASRRVSTVRLLGNWGIVWVGNFVGAFGTAVIVYVSKQYTFGDGAVGQTALAIASTKTSLGFVEAVALGMLCNALVCLAVWLTYGARTTTDKILAIMADPAILVATHYVVPSQYAGEPAMERESYLIAAVAGLLSSAWWLAFGNAATSFAAYLRRHRPGRI